MDLQQRINLLAELGKYMISNTESWQDAKQKANSENPWFIREFVGLASRNIADCFLQKDVLESFVHQYDIKEPSSQKNVGIVMAGNIPLVGFHDFLCAFLSGHKQTIKLSSRDSVLLKHLIEYMASLDGEVKQYVAIQEVLKGCDAYIATGSNNSSRYFEYYFGKFPNIIRRNRTSVAILTGKEEQEELSELAKDVYLYFGLGCRNVTKLYVPQDFDFVPLLENFKTFNYLFDFHKYRHNYDYQLALLMLNKQYYMTNGSILLAENKSIFSAISVLHYEFYTDFAGCANSLQSNNDIQAIIGEGFTKPGKSQAPAINDYADKADTLQFLLNL